MRTRHRFSARFGPTVLLFALLGAFGCGDNAGPTQWDAGDGGDAATDGGDVGADADAAADAPADAAEDAVIDASADTDATQSDATDADAADVPVSDTDAAADTTPDGDTADDADSAVDAPADADTNADGDAAPDGDAASDAEVDSAANECGGASELLWLGEAARPGDPCGCDGLLACDGVDALRCDGEPEDTCGGCGDPDIALGAPCGLCESGSWACSDAGLACVGAVESRNACGGCSTLEGEPETACGDGGAWFCADADTVSCGEPDRNACGGTEVLPHVLGESCGECADGAWQCDGRDAVRCDGPSERNACDGCGVLAGQPGDTCGAFQAWECDGVADVRCVFDGTPGVLGPDGGTVAIEGVIEVVVPPGALDDYVLFSIVETDIVCVPGWELLSAVYRVEPVGVLGAGVEVRITSELEATVWRITTGDPTAGVADARDGDWVVASFDDLGWFFAGRLRDTEICRNTCDDDGDGFAECDDSDCVVACGGCLTSDDCEPGFECDDAGSCAPDPCFGVDCTVAPEDRCEGDVAVRYGGAGRCEDGSCVGYTEVTENCADSDRVCRGAGACIVPDPCEDVICDSPPADSCEANTATRYAPAGSCEGGACVYAPTSVPCAANEECVGAGLCVPNPCFGVDCSTAPTDFCTGDRATRYSGTAVCVDGACVGFVTDVVDCAASGEMCTGAGLCVPIPCDPSDCANSVPDRCEGNVARDEPAFGSCVAGVCEFPAAVTTDCTGIGRACVAGACVGAPCVGGDCVTPPVDDCRGNVAVRYEDAVGVCAPDGFCTYNAPVEQDCTLAGLVCVEGACVPDPCAGVFCGRFELPYCDGNVAVTPLPDGACVAGDCVYTDDRLDCGDDICVAGRCEERVPLCDDATCGVLPDPFCTGNVATSYSGGFCDGDDCIVFTDETNCAATGRVCAEGACIFSVCGDATCDSAESCFSCRADCGVCEAPDNPWIAFIQRGDSAYPAIERGSDQLTFVRADGTGAVELAQSNVLETTPAWSPNGRRLAYRATDSGFALRLFVIDFDTGTRVSVAHSFSRIGAVTWTRSGNWLVVTGRRTGDTADRLYLTNPATGAFFPITSLAGGDSATVCSAVADRCYFLRLLGGSAAQIHSIDYNEATGQGTNLTPYTFPNPGAPYAGLAGGQLSVNSDATRLTFNGFIAADATRPYVLNLTSLTAAPLSGAGSGDQQAYYLPLGGGMTILRPFADVTPSAELVLADDDGTTLVRLTNDLRLQSFAVASSIDAAGVDLAPWTRAIP